VSEFKAPIFIIAAPRSGSTLLYEALSKHPKLVSIQGESHKIIESIPALSIVAKNFSSNVLGEEDATSSVVRHLHTQFLSACHTHTGDPINLAKGPFRFLEKTPKNALRIPFLAKMYPDAKFVYLVREPVANIASIMDAWLSGRFVTYPRLPGWRGDWSLLLPPQWQSQRDKPLGSVAAFQWSQAHHHVINALNDVPVERVCTLHYQALIDDPNTQCNRIFEFTELDEYRVANGTQENDKHIEGLPLSRFTLTAPRNDKWHKHAGAIAQQHGQIDSSLCLINQFMLERGGTPLTANTELFEIAEQGNQALKQTEKILSLNGNEATPVFGKTLLQSTRLSRNAVCHCGSGKRYKHCHGKP